MAELRALGVVFYSTQSLVEETVNDTTNATFETSHARSYGSSHVGMWLPEQYGRRCVLSSQRFTTFTYLSNGFCIKYSQNRTHPLR